jgi:hypothetical protein
VCKSSIYYTQFKIARIVSMHIDDSHPISYNRKQRKVNAPNPIHILRYLLLLLSISIGWKRRSRSRSRSSIQVTSRLYCTFLPDFLLRLLFFFISYKLSSDLSYHLIKCTKKQKITVITSRLMLKGTLEIKQLIQMKLFSVFLGKLTIK